MEGADRWHPGGESQAAAMSWSQVFYLGSETEICCKPEAPPCHDPAAQVGFAGVGEEQRFSHQQPPPPAPPLLGAAHWVVQCLSPGPAHASNQSGSKNILLEKAVRAVCLTHSQDSP